MKSKNFNINKKTAYEACKNALAEFDCDIIHSDFSKGIIESKKGGNILSYGHRIYISIKFQCTHIVHIY